MTKATLTKTLGTILAIFLAGLAVFFKDNPQVSAVLAIVSTNLVSWLHLTTPGTVRVSELPASRIPQ